jgi:hypothetical protein
LKIGLRQKKRGETISEEKPREGQKNKCRERQTTFITWGKQFIAPKFYRQAFVALPSVTSKPRAR